MNVLMKRKDFFSLLLAIAITNGDTCRADQPVPIPELKRRAEQGDSGAALSLGFRYRDGVGVDRDYAEALRWYRRSADQGDAAGLDNVGFMYLRGQGVPRHPGIAVAFFKAGAEGGNSQAGYNLGNCHFDGQGVTQDYGEAIKAWESAARAKHGNAMWRLAMMHAAGEGVPRDVEKAERMCREIAAKGHGPAMLLLGELCDREGDRSAARRWWRKAAESGLGQGEALLELARWKKREAVAGQRAYVEVDHIYQGWNNCGATSIAMFLRQSGGDLSPYDVKRLCPQSPIGTGTDWQHLVAVAPRAGQDWELITFANDDEGFSRGVTGIRNRLDRQQPVVIDFTVKRDENGRVTHYGHTLLVVGYDVESNRFVLKNPNQPSPGIELMTSEQLKANWFSRGYSRSARGRAARPLIVHKSR